MSDEDAISCLNSIKPDEVLEVAVYGGMQAACVNNEEFTVTIKEEELDDHIDIISLEHQNPNEALRYNFLNQSIVYTTRLDHMQAFDKIERHGSKEITEMILKESKPRYKQTAELNKVELINADITTYVQLKCQVHHMNTKVKIETFRRNDKLLKLCKPLKIVLTDIKTLVKAEPQKIPTDDDFVKFLSEESSDDEPLSIFKEISHKNKTVRANNVHATTAVAIKDIRSQEVDLYILDPNTCIKSYYRTGKDQFTYLQELHKSSRRAFLEYCCWVNREKLINNLHGITRICTTYMRTRHNCLPRPCSCCCASSDLPNKRSKLNIQFQKSISKNKLITPISSNNFIEKALNFVQKVDVRQVPIPANSNCLKNAVIIIKYHEIMFAQSEILGENYEIGIGGDVINYVRPTVNRSITEEEQLYQKHDKPNESRIYFSSLVCCWHRREGIIAQLRESLYILPSTLRFIKSPHPCKVAKCMCCCKPGPMRNFILRRQPTVRLNNKQDNAPISKVSYRKHTLHDEKRRAIYFNDRSKELNLQKYRNVQAKLESTQQSQKKIPKSNIPKQTTTVRKSFVGKQSSRIKKPGDKTAGSSQQVPIPHTKHQTNLNPDANKEPAQPTITYTSLTKSFLDNIKDFEVTVNENGKLTAVINASPGQMPTADVKMISDVLLLAAEQIKALGISPQEFCNRVNKSKSMDGLNSILVPKLAPIQSNASSNAVNAKLPMSGINALTLMKTSSTPGFKTPKTREVNPVCSIYQMMSSIGGKKNQLLIEAYRIHFGEKRVNVKAPSSNSNSYRHRLNSNKDWVPPKITKELLNTNDNPHDGMATLTPILKRKINQIANEPTGKKYRHVHVSQLPTIEPAQLKNGKTGTETFTLQKKANVMTPVPLPNQHVMNTDVQVPHSSINRNLMSTQNLIDSVVPSLVAINNITPLQKISTSDPLFQEHNFVTNPMRPLSGTIPQTDKKTETLIIVGDNFDDDPKPDLEDGIVADNPLLFGILSKTSTPCPTRLGRKSVNTFTKQRPPIKRRPRMNSNLNMDLSDESEVIRKTRLGRESVKTFTRQRPPIKSKPRMNSNLNMDLSDEFEVISDDFESMLKTNVISMKENGSLSHEEILETVNNKQLITENDEGEGIFGV